MSAEPIMEPVMTQVDPIDLLNAIEGLTGPGSRRAHPSPPPQATAPTPGALFS
ncbi:hypothetical protein ACWCRF_21085 [Streptomyces sp. NPDC002405]|uniref:hypothetical protein n=1 Tax=unclassified Streptomyces TaxID=2593676 RepID=UPI0036816E0B